VILCPYAHTCAFTKNTVTETHTSMYVHTDIQYFDTNGMCMNVN